MTIANIKEVKDEEVKGVHCLLTALGNAIRLLADYDPELRRIRREFLQTVKDEKTQQKGL